MISLIFPLIAVSIYYSPYIDPAITGDLRPFGGGIIDELDPYIGAFPEAESLQNTFFGVGIFFAILFILGALFLIISGIKVKTGSKKMKKARRKWLRNGLSYIIIELILFFSLAYGIPIALKEAVCGLEMSFTIGMGMIIVVGGILVFAYTLAKIAD